MPQKQLLTLKVDYTKDEQGREDVLFVITGHSRDLKRIYTDRQDILNKYKEKRLVTPFLCGSNMLLVSCGDLLRDHRQYGPLVEELLSGYTYHTEITRSDSKTGMVITKEAVTQMLVPSAGNEGLQPEALGGALPPKTSHDKKIYSEADIFACIKLRVKVKIGNEFTLVRFNDVTYDPDNEAANALYTQSTQYMLRQLMRCGYEFKKGEELVLHSGEGYAYAKVSITKTGDKNRINDNMHGDLANTIEFAKLSKGMKFTV